MSEPTGTGIQFAEDAARYIKWSERDKKTRIQLTLFLIGLSTFFIWNLGYYDTFALLGIGYVVHLLSKLFNEIKSWFKKK